MQPLIFRIFLILICYCVLGVQAQNKLETYDKSDGLTSVQITTTLVDSRGIVWFGTGNGLNAYTGREWVPIKHIEDNTTGTLKPLGIVKTIFEDLNRNIWVSSDKGIFLYNRNYWTFYQPEDDNKYIATDFIQDRSGSVWVTMEYLQDLSDEMGFSMVSGKLLMYKEHRWYNFDSDLAGTVSIKIKETPSYFTKIFQDRLGNMWFSTLEGVFKFDGVDWEDFKEEELDAKKILDLVEDKDGNIWAATENGVSVRDSEGWKNYTKKDGLKDNFIYKICLDQNDNVWAFSRNEMRFTALNAFEGDAWKTYDAGKLKFRSEVEQLIWYEESLLAYAKDGISTYNGNIWERIDDDLSEKYYTYMNQNRSKVVYLAGDRGAYASSGENWELLYRSETKWDVNEIFKDRKNRIWIGTEKNGAYVRTNNRWVHFTEENGLSDDHVDTIFEDRFSNVWIVTKKGLSKFTNNDLSN